MTILEQLQYYKTGYKNVSGYLKDRGIDEATASEFELGYCSVGAPDPVGMFRGRMMIPMYDHNWDLVAFSGRSLNGNGPKYINSAESALYKKSRILYGLERSQDYILKAGYVVCVEGQLDMIQLWKAGIKNVVASCGTALTKYHIRLLKRFADYVIICYDGDRAGEKAAERALEGLADERMPIKYAVIPQGLDPDEYVRVYGVEQMDEVLLGAK